MPPIQIKLDSKQLQLTVEGVNKLGNAAKQAVMDEIGYTAVDMLGKSVEKLKSNGSVATSNLANSGRVKKMKNYWTVGYTASYAWVVEYGRKAGTYPPIQPLMDWVHKKKIAFQTKVTLRGKNAGKTRRVKGDKYEQRVKSIAIAISKSIKKTGIKPKPFLIPAFNEVMKGFNTRVINALNRVLI
jgi:hypothetical protein